MADKVKSGKKILDDFFENITEIKDVAKDIAQMINTLYKDNKLTDINVKNELQKLREQDDKD